MPEKLEMQVELGVDGVAGGHPAYLQAAEEFVHDIREQPGIAVAERAAAAPPSGAKGAVQELILAPGTATLALAAVKIMKLWLSRDRRRTIDININRPGSEPVTLHASGEHISLDVLEETVRRALDA